MKLRDKTEFHDEEQIEIWKRMNDRHESECTGRDFVNAIMEKIARRTIKTVNSIVDLVVLTIVLLLLAFAGYALWDSNQLYEMADKSQYEVYKPTALNEGKSFKELQDINPEVFAWLSVYGTNIDYPVTQGDNNMKYVNTNAEGQYSLSGAIFMDYRNSQDFSDFNSILYGHHMEKRTMFGEIGTFSERSVFDTYRYGNLYFDGKDHGIEFFAFIHADAYDYTVFRPNVGEGEEQAYLDGLLEKAIHTRNIGVTTTDRIVLLSTCSTDSTNGRDILVGRMSDKVFDDMFSGSEANDKVQATSVPDDQVKEIYLLPILLMLLLTARLIHLIISVHRKYKRQNLGTGI